MYSIYWKVLHISISQKKLPQDSSCNCFVQSNCAQSRAKLLTACFCSSVDVCLRWWRRCMSSSCTLSIPLMIFRPKLLLNWVSSSIGWRNPFLRPNSTWKYGRCSGYDLRSPFTLVSMSFLALCWLHSLSASSISWNQKIELETYEYKKGSR